jgi:endogenous inhibitor of DNA gyrase (YacG/DUF329 family)
MSDESSPAGPSSPCPICAKPASARHKPFCSQRCGTIDLARWITGNYRVPSEELPGDERAPGEDAEEP